MSNYYEARVLDGGLCTCHHLDACAASATPNLFAAGQLSFVGKNYAMTRDGRPWRIVIVSMQTGETEAPITIEGRREQFGVRVDQDFMARNAHIRGVTSALRVLWGREAGRDRDGEWLVTADGPVHVLDAHALMNATLCSSVKVPGSREGTGSDAMHHNCTEHLRATLELLEPTIVHSQGRRKIRRAATPHRSMLEVVDREPDWESDYVALATLEGRPFVWVSVGHPSAKGEFAWQYPESRRFHEIVGPELRRAHELAVRLAA